MMHRGRSRVVPLGPKAREQLLPWLDSPGLGLGDEEYIWSPALAMKNRSERLREPRRSKVTTSQLARGKKNRQRSPGLRYETGAYAHAIAKACKKAGVPVWGPNRLRHTAATEIRKRFGLEAAQAVLGHATMTITEVYAEKNVALAVQVAAAIG